MNEYEIKDVETYLQIVKTVSATELQLRFGKGYCWAHKVLTHFKEKGMLVLNDVYGNYEVLKSDTTSEV